MAAPALTLLGPSALLVAGSVANLAARPMPLSLSPERTWLRRGGFIGVLNGRSTGSVATPPAAPTEVAAPAATPKSRPIGGRTDKPSPPTPFGRFPRHKPVKLPGPPKPYTP